MRDRKLTFLQHLEELRRRLFRAAIGLVIAVSIGFAVTPRLFHLLLVPAGGVKPVFIEVTEMLGTYFRVAFMAGIALAFPIILYEVVMFIAPGLTSRERRYLFFALPAAFLLFLVGVLFSYFVFLPPALRFLLRFGSDIATPQIRIGNYIDVVTRLLLFSGLSFETPLVLLLLAKIGIISYRGLARFRPWAVVGAFALGAIITPTFDPINQSLVALPLIALYELSIWLSWLFARPPKAQEAG